MDGFLAHGLPICFANIHSLNSELVTFLQGVPDSGDLEISFRVALMPRCMNLVQMVGNFRVILLIGLLSNTDLHLISFSPNGKGKKTGFQLHGL